MSKDLETISFFFFFLLPRLHFTTDVVCESLVFPLHDDLLRWLYVVSFIGRKKARMARLLQFVGFPRMTHLAGPRQMSCCFVVVVASPYIWVLLPCFWWEFISCVPMALITRLLPESEIGLRYGSSRMMTFKRNQKMIIIIVMMMILHRRRRRPPLSVRRSVPWTCQVHSNGEESNGLWFWCGVSFWCWSCRLCAVHYAEAWAQMTRFYLQL